MRNQQGGAEIYSYYQQDMHNIALKALTIIPSLLLQKPNKKSKAKERNECLKRRLDLWHEGDFDKLVREVRFIQKS